MSDYQYQIVWWFGRIIKDRKREREKKKIFEDCKNVAANFKSKIESELTRKKNSRSIAHNIVTKMYKSIK